MNNNVRRIINKRAARKAAELSRQPRPVTPNDDYNAREWLNEMGFDLEAAPERYSRAIEWPNKLGWDVNEYEVFKTKTGLCVKSFEKAAIVVSTSDPVEAVRLAREQGFNVKELDEMEAPNAEALFRSKLL